MRIKAGTYPQEPNWQKFITFTRGPEINRVFLCRLAAYVRDIIKAPVTMYGHRSIADQQVAYDLYLAGKGPTAAKPGSSWHNYGLAVDFNRLKTVNGVGVYPGSLDADYKLWAAGKPEILNKYGLSHSAIGESWHIIPIEAAGYTGDRGWYADEDDYVNTVSGYPQLQLTTPQTCGNSVILMQRTINRTRTVKIKEDGVFGANTEKALKEYQALKKLTADGICGQQTWAEILKDIAAIPVDYKALYDKAQARIKVIEAQCADKDVKIASLNTQLLSERSQKDLLNKKIEAAIAALK